MNLFLTRPTARLLALLAFVFVIGLYASSASAAPVVANATATEGTCTGDLNVELSLNGAVFSEGSPTEIMFVVDESGSVDASEFTDMSGFLLDVVDELDTAGLFAGGGTAGVVKFSTFASLRLALSDNKTSVESSLQTRFYPGGSTSTALALQRARAAFSPPSATPTTRVMILVTDGYCTCTLGDINTQVAANNAAGITTFAIGIDAANSAELTAITGSPARVFTTADFDSLADILDDLIDVITLSGTSGIEVQATLAPEFTLFYLAPPAIGVATANGSTITWTIEELGSEEVTLNYTITHTLGGPGGVLPVHAQVTYSDDENNSVIFPVATTNMRGCPDVVTLSPATAQAVEGSEHTVTATVIDDFDEPINGTQVDFTVISGPNAGVSGFASTDSNGQASFSYPGVAGLGTDTIRADPAESDAPAVTAKVTWIDTTEPVYRDYEGTATVKVKNGNAYSTYNVATCATVQTVGRTGPIVDVWIVGRIVSGEGGGCGDYCLDECQPTVVLENFVQPPLLPGTFLIDTSQDEIQTGGFGWKANPVKQTASQWQFTLKKPLADAGAVFLNNGIRPMQANTTVLAKFLRDRDGLYFKVAGFAPLNSNGTPKVTIEIASDTAGLDAAPFPVFLALGAAEPISRWTTFLVRYSEPVTVDADAVTLTCDDEPQQFMLTGQGTSLIGIDPVMSLPFDSECQLLIPGADVEDVDTVDPPSTSVLDVGRIFLVENTNY